MTIKKCEVCGKEFESKSKGVKFCGRDCKNTNNRMKYHARKNGLMPPAEPRKKRPKPNQELVRLSIEAREHRLTYGQYVAMLERGARYERKND